MQWFVNARDHFYVLPNFFFVSELCCRNLNAKYTEFPHVTFRMLPREKSIILYHFIFIFFALFIGKHRTRVISRSLVIWRIDLRMKPCNIYPHLGTLKRCTRKYLLTLTRTRSETVLFIESRCVRTRVSTFYKQRNSIIIRS